MRNPELRPEPRAPAEMSGSKTMSTTSQRGVRPDLSLTGGQGRRLLAVSYHFPPGEAVGALRWGGLTKYLGRQGWNVRVLSGFGSGSWEHAPSVQVEGRPSRSTLNDRYLAWKKSRSRKQQNGTRPEGGMPPNSSSGESLPRKAVRELGGLLSWPDEGRGWMVPAFRATKAAIQSFSPDVIVSSGPPHSAHLAVRLARGRSDIPWFMDLRDPWEPMAEVPRIVRSTFRWLAPGTIRSSSGVIVTTPELRDLLAEEYPGFPVHWVPNGVDLDLFPAPDAPPFPGLSLVHLGSVYRGRDPSPLLAAFGRFLGANPDAAKAGSAIRFVGTVEGEHRNTVDQASRGALRNHVELIAQRPRAEALSILQRSSLSVVLAQRQWEMVPAKLYESVALGLPTLVIAEAGSATFEAAGRLGALRAEPEDIAGIAGICDRVWSGETPPIHDSEIPLEYGELAQLIGEILLT